MGGGRSDAPASPSAAPPVGAQSVAGTMMPYVDWTTPSPIDLPLTPYAEAAAAAWEALDSSGVADSSDREASMEEFKAACMKERGFTYHPELAEPAPDAASERRGYRQLSIVRLPETLAEAERVGYGVSSPDETGAGELAASAEQSKNEEYRAGLTPSALREYDLALYGYYDRDSYSDQNAVDMSCASQAQAAYPSTPEPSEAAYVESLLDPLAQAAEAFKVEFWTDNDGVYHEEFGPYALPGDPRMAQLASDYGKCLEANAVGWDASGVDDPTGAVSVAMMTAPDGSQYQDWPDPGDSVDAVTIPAEYRSLVGSQLEIDIAVADFKCRQQTDYVNRYASIQADAEARYVADHQREFDKMLAALEAFTADH